MKVNQRGTATLLGIAAMALVLLIVITGLIIINLSGKLIAKQLLYKGQAYNAAQAGLVNGLTWFRIQNTQPVVAFDPKVDPAADPPIDESDHPGIGIVREFDVSKMGSVKGRYEVRRQVVDVLGDGSQIVDFTGTGMGVVDTSAQRGKNSPGRVWQIESLGIIYVDHEDDGMNWPNDKNGNPIDGGIIGRPESGEGDVLVTQTVRADIQRLTTVLPGGAAVVGQALTTINGKARVRGISGIGVVYSGANPPSLTGTGFELSGVQPSAQDPAPFEGSIQEVFGVTEDELFNMADLKGNIGDIPNQLPAMQLIVIKGNNGAINFDSTRPLVGSGILVILDADVVVSADTNANFNGLIYIRGTYTQNAPSLVSGSIMLAKKSDGTGGTSTITGTGGDYSEVDYDPAIIQQVQNQLGQYRFSRAPYLVSLN
jgi:hypothetical protein